MLDHGPSFTPQPELIFSSTGAPSARLAPPSDTRCEHISRTVSSGRNMKDLLHVAVGSGGGLFRTAAVLTGAQVGSIPIPPVVFGVRLLVVSVVLLSLAEELCKGREIRGLRLRKLPFASGKPRLDLL